MSVRGEAGRRKTPYIKANPGKNVTLQMKIQVKMHRTVYKYKT